MWHKSHTDLSFVLNSTLSVFLYCVTFNEKAYIVDLWWMTPRTLYVHTTPTQGLWTSPLHITRAQRACVHCARGVYAVYVVTWYVACTSIHVYVACTCVCGSVYVVCAVHHVCAAYSVRVMCTHRHVYTLTCFLRTHNTQQIRRARLWPA